jgi:hypothetical protein
LWPYVAIVSGLSILDCPFGFLLRLFKTDLLALAFVGTYMYLDEEFEQTKGVIRIRKSKDRQCNDQKKKDKQRSTKHYTEN